VKDATALRLVGTLVGIKLVLHFATNLLGPYEFHRDEFLYMAMGEHLQLFRMDFPPFIAMLSEFTRGVMGDSVFALRLFPALGSVSLMVFAALIARELGGGRFAQGLAALCVLANVLFQRSGNLFQPVVFDQLWWTIGLYALVRLVNSDDPRWWLAFGGACGFGLLSKFSILIFGAAVFLALVVTSSRRWLVTRWPWIAVAVVFVIGGPSLVGQIRLGLPIFNQMADLQQAQLARVSLGDFLAGNAVWGPSIAVAVVGLIALVGGDRLRLFRVVGWSCLWAFILLILSHGKSYYAGPVYPTLFAAGAVVLEALRVPRWDRIVRGGTVAAVIAYGMLLFPLGFPIVPPPPMERYLARLGMTRAQTTNIGDIERLPQDYADMLGWQEQVAAVARVFHDLSPGDQQRAVLLASNYGEAGAIDFYGPRHDIPHAITPTGTYWFFGPGDKPGEVTITVGITRQELEPYFGTLDSAAHFTHPYMVAEERDVTIFIARNPRQTLQAIWPSFEGR
jgi:hypothetical protein